MSSVRVLMKVRINMGAISFSFFLATDVNGYFKR